VEIVMTSQRIDMRPRRSEPDQSVPPETWMLLTLALSGLATLLWMGLFAWANARAVGLL
jgi:cytoskeletal protein RodZ